MRNLIIVSCLFFVLGFKTIICVLLGKEAGQYLRDVLREFECTPQNGRFDQIVEGPHAMSKLIPKLFIWCPIRHYGLTILCPIHGCPLKVGQWTDLPDSSNTSPRNPRLIYDLNGNVILVQAFYECSESLPENVMIGHRYLSASNDVLGALPESVVKEFPLIMQQRSGFTLRLYDYLITGIYQGQNFMELSEGIASMNYRQYMRNKPDSKELSVKEFESIPFIAYPSNDKLMDLFLMQFDRNKKHYENNMQKHTGEILSCDHTFRTNKHIGVTREDGKFVGQFKNVFLGVNENGEVMIWKFTKTTSSSEIIDSLKELKERLDKASTNLKMIIVDDCCHVMHLYGQIFPGIKVRLDLFHACMRVVQTVPKSEDYSKQFANEFSLIFRQNGDLGNERTMSTPCPDEIESNLERLLFVWREKLKTETLLQIENLRKHIKKGCLSEIPVGCGTEINERLHRHLNRSLLCGVSKIGPELAVAVMACALYAWNCKRRLKTTLNKRTIPITPIELEPLESLNQATPYLQSHMTAVDSTSTSLPGSISGTVSENSSKASRMPGTSSVFVTVKTVEELENDSVLNYILERALHIQEFITSWTTKCNNKTIDLIGLLWKINLPAGNLYEQESKLNVMELNLTPQHKDNLLRNLTGFNLQLDPINKDGNCFFRATARQLQKHLQRSDLQNLQHISSLGLGINEERDTENLRLLFVHEVTENLDEYREWMSCSSNVREIERFKTDGHFASDIGDICAKACANLLRVPIIVITALPNVPSIPFLPKHFITAVPMYLAYDHSGPGHYDATKGK